MSYSEQLNQKREQFSIRIRNSYKKESMLDFRRRLCQNLTSLPSKTDLSAQIQNLIQQANLDPQLGIENLAAFVEENENTIIDVLQWHSETIIRLAIKHIHLKRALMLIGLMVRAGASSNYLQLQQVVNRVVQAIRKNLNDLPYVKIGVWILMLLAADSWQEYQQFFQVPKLCNQLYTLLGNHIDLVQLISYLAQKQRQYFPSFPNILRGILHYFHDCKEQQRVVCFDIVSGFIKHAPQGIEDFLKPMLEVCICISNKKQFVGQCTEYSRKEAFRCLIRLINTVKGLATRKMVQMNVIHDTIYRLQRDSFQIRLVCLRLLQAFFREADYQLILQVLMRANDFLDILQIHGLDQESKEMKLPALRIFLSCLEKSSSVSRQNCFLRMLEPNRQNLVYSLKSMEYDMSYQVGALATQIYNAYFQFQNESLENDRQY